MPTLNADKTLWTDLWPDQPNAHDLIRQKLECGEVTDEEASNLEHFVDHDYLVFTLKNINAIAEGFERDLRKLSESPPHDLLVVPKGQPHRIPYDELDSELLASNRFRIVDLHSHSPAAQDLYLSPEIFRYTDLLFGQKSIAFQSLYFIEGSEQALHRDPMFVVTQPASHLLASWVALEDIPADCGPLSFVPGSHVVPYFEFGPDRIVSSKEKEDMDKRPLQQAFMREQFAKRGLKTNHFICKKGEVLLWHGNLMHGGSAITRAGATRKSFVVHYSTYGNYTSRRVTYRTKARTKDNIAEMNKSATTSKRLERFGNAGLQNPLYQDQV